MTAPLPTTPTPPDQGPPPAPGAPGAYRSVADRELLSAWTLGEFFTSVNAVLRLPARPKPAPEAGAAGGGLRLPSLSHIRIPKPVLAAGMLLVLGVTVVRPIVLAATTADTTVLASAFGVWMADNGRYAGRMFELDERSIAFRTSKDSPEYTWHKITRVRTTPAGDSTLFLVSYEESGRQAEFGLWYLGGKTPVIHVQHQAGVNWRKTPYAPIARPPS